MAKKKAVKKTALKKGSAAAKAKMAKVRKAKKNYILVEKDRQTKVKTTNSGGYLYPYNKAKDKANKAMPPGKRISKKTGNPYWEYRVNRSDKKGSLTGEKHLDKNSHNYNFTISGVNKESVLNKLYKDYGIIHSQIYKATTKGQKNIFKRLLTNVKNEINKIKKLK